MGALIDGHQNPLQADIARVELNEAVHTGWHEERRQRRPADERRCHLPVQPSGDATTLVRGEHDQIGSMVAEIAQNRVGRIWASDFHLAYAQPKGRHRFPRAIRREQTPMCQRLPHLRKLVDVMSGIRIVREVEDRQGPAARERQLQGVSKGHLAGRRKVRWMEDPYGQAHLGHMEILRRTSLWRRQAGLDHTRAEQLRGAVCTRDSARDSARD